MRWLIAKSSIESEHHRAWGDLLSVHTHPQAGRQGRSLTGALQRMVTVPLDMGCYVLVRGAIIQSLQSATRSSVRATTWTPGRIPPAAAPAAPAAFVPAGEWRFASPAVFLLLLLQLEASCRAAASWRACAIWSLHCVLSSASVGSVVGGLDTASSCVEVSNAYAAVDDSLTCGASSTHCGIENS